jgi:hypothetical protein
LLRLIAKGCSKSASGDCSLVMFGMSRVRFEAQAVATKLTKAVIRSETRSRGAAIKYR